ncbi:hypothetical protein ACQ4PT_004265 [Festuca glaucescens]
MPLAITPEGEGSGSRKSRSRGRMRQTEFLESKATPALHRGSKQNWGGTSTAATFGMTTRSMERAQHQSSLSKSANGPAEGCSKRKRAKLAGISRRASSERSSKKGKRSQDRLERKAKKINRWGEEDDGSCSSVVSSPLREPYMPVLVERYPDGTQIRKPIDTATSNKYRDMQQYYYGKLARQMEMPTLIPDTPPNCLVNDPMLLHIREPSRKIVLRAAQFVVGISSSIDGEPLARCSGFWIDYDTEKRTGTVVTTAHLIRTERPSLDAWLCKDEYAPNAQVTVHLRGGTDAKAYLLYHQKHYDLAFFRVRMDSYIQEPYFSDEVTCAQDIFELGRDESADLVINHGRVEYSNPTVYERHHHMYIQGPHRDREYDKGGPVIDLHGKVVGMIDSCPAGSFIPSSILLKCFHLWRNFERIRRPHLGLKFSAISLLNPVQVEKILIEYKIDEGLIVEELENMLLSILVDSGDGFDSYLDMEIQLYCTRRHLRRNKVLTVKVSEDGEFVARGIQVFSAKSYLKMIHILCSIF